jgi:hypothetical protein
MWWRRATELTAARVLNIRASHITGLATLPMMHKDPFDRIHCAGQGRGPRPRHERRVKSSNIRSRRSGSVSWQPVRTGRLLGTLSTFTLPITHHVGYPQSVR